MPMTRPPAIKLPEFVLLSDNPLVIPRPAQWRALDGVVLLDKPVGLTSNQALQSARRLLGASKGGHAGTLDPFATGVLPLCLGEATKFSADLLNADKSYVATLQFGATTDTGDLTGRVTQNSDVFPTAEALEAALAGFAGESEQIPPMYSALKRDGQPLYKLARAGLEIERQPRKIHLSELAWSDWVFDAEGRVIRASLAVRCSKGAYMRTLAEDIALAVGSLAHLTALRRTRVGEISLEGCKTLDFLVSEAVALDPEPANLTQEVLCQAELMQPVDFLLRTLQRLDITDRQAVFCRHGNPFAAEPGQNLPIGSNLRFYLDGRFIGIGQAVIDKKDVKIQPVRLVSTSQS